MKRNRQIGKSIIGIANSALGRIIVLTGARQVGKTTLVQNVATKYKHLSIEDPVGRLAYTSLSATQWEQLYPQAVLDEVQKEPQLIESIKATYDAFDHVRYILTGSSQLLLLQKVKESLAGRSRIIELYPLVLPEIVAYGWGSEIRFSEWQQLVLNPSTAPSFLPSLLIDPLYGEKEKAWRHLITFGGYPAVVDEKLSDEERWQWLRSYVQTYLERDIRDLVSFRDLEPFVKLQHAVAAQTAQTYSLSTLGRDTGASGKTVQRYLQYLSISYQTIILPAWDRNPNKRIAKAAKIHFLDYGVLQAVLQKRGGMTEAEFESLIVSEIYKQTKNTLADAKFHHLRTQDGREIDLLVEFPQGYYAFEIKMSSNIHPTDARHLRNLSEFLDKPLLHSFVVSNDPQTKSLGDGTTAVNATLFLG